jgi:hypothetical protein
MHLETRSFLQTTIHGVSAYYKAQPTPKYSPAVGMEQRTIAVTTGENTYGTVFINGIDKKPQPIDIKIFFHHIFLLKVKDSLKCGQIF